MTDQTNHAAMDAETLEAIANDFEQIETTENTRPGDDYQPPEIPTSELIYPIISFSCDITAPNWQISEVEKQALSKAYGDLLDKYFPDVNKNMGVELNALLMTAAIFAPRISTPRKIEQVKEDEAEKNTETTRPGDNKKPTPQALQGFEDLPEG